MKKSSMKTLSKSKALDTSIAKAQVAPDLLKPLAILSDTTVRRSAVDQEDLKNHTGDKKRSHFYWWSTSLFISFLKTLLNKEDKTSKKTRLIKRLAGAVACSCRPFPNILKYKDHPNETIQQSGKLEKKTPSDTYWRVQPACMKVQGHSSLKPAMGKIRTTYLWCIKVWYDLILTIFGSVANRNQPSVITDHLGLLVGQNRCRFFKMTKHN